MKHTVSDCTGWKLCSLSTHLPAKAHTMLVLQAPCTLLLHLEALTMQLTTLQPEQTQHMQHSANAEGGYTTTRLAAA